MRIRRDKGYLLNLSLYNPSNEWLLLVIVFGLLASFVFTAPIKLDTVELFDFLLCFSCGRFLSKYNRSESGSLVVNPSSKIGVRLWYIGVAVFEFVRFQKFLACEIEGER